MHAPTQRKKEKSKEEAEKTKTKKEKDDLMDRYGFALVDGYLGEYTFLRVSFSWKDPFSSCV